MNWRDVVEPALAYLAPADAERLLTQVAPDHDHAERLGFTCELDVYLGFGRCTYVREDADGLVRIVQTYRSWTRILPSKGQRYYHTLDQALRDEHCFAERNPAGIVVQSHKP